MQRTFLLLLTFSFLLNVGCNRDARLANHDVPISKGPEREKRLLEMIESLHDELEVRISEIKSNDSMGGKDKYEQTSKICRELFNERIGTDEHAQNDLLEAVLLDQKDDGARTLCLEELIVLLARQGRREPLIKLLSSRCPDYLFLHTGIEDLLIIINRRTLSDGATILFAAYDKASDQNVKNVIFQAIERSFRFTGIPSSDRDKFVAKCREWYTANAREYEPNIGYLSHLNTGNFDYSEEGVLTKKK